MANNVSMEQIVELAKRRGFVFPSSEIYGGLGSAYDYGPLGVLLKNNVKEAWWRAMVQEREDIVGLDAAILMHPKVWEASGHVESFADFLLECRNCHFRYKAEEVLPAEIQDKIVEKVKREEKKMDEGRLGETSKQEVRKYLQSLVPDINKKVECPNCGNKSWTPPDQFNLMFRTAVGSSENSSQLIYLRPETAQGMYVNFENVRRTVRRKLPFGIAQIGKAFRNEITPKNFTFRMREFEQMEMQYFCAPEDAPKFFEQWKEQRISWYERLGLPREKLILHDHAPKELAHYAKQAVDLTYPFPFGPAELEGIHNRGDWDLGRHMKFSGHEFWSKEEGQEKTFIPYVIETSGGVDRATLAFLLDAYTQVEGGRTTTTEATKEKEVVLRLHKSLAPIKAAVLPLSKKEKLVAMAKEITALLRPHWMIDYDEVASIGRRYRRQDEIGTPFCITVDFDSLEDRQVTVRDRDSMKQDRIAKEELVPYLSEKLSG